MKRKVQSQDKLYQCQYNAALKAVDSMYFHDEEKTKIWLECPNPLLGNVSPISMLKLGRFSKLMKFIYTQIYDNEVSEMEKNNVY